MKKTILFFLLISIFIKLKAQINFCFTPPTHFACNTPSYLCNGDFNMDGKMDIAALSLSGISVILGNGNGGFGAPLASATTGTQLNSICSVDFNNDGKLDIAFANVSLSSVSVLLGNGNGTFGAQTNFATGTFPRKLVNADFNNDGKMDLATANGNSYNISILLGNGNGSFGNAINIPTGTGSNAYWCLVNADFNTDGNQDLIYGANGSIYIMFGTGTGSFGSGTLIPNSSGIGAVTDDFNGDGKKDLAITNPSLAKVFILLGDGLGSFVASYNFNVTSGVSELLSADLNGDNKKDLVANFLFIYSGDGTGIFNYSNYNGGQGGGYIASDFNSDGKLDLAGGYNFGGITDIQIYLNGFEPSINILSQTNVSCGQANDGTISIDVPTGNQPFSYYWSNGSQSSNLTGLSPGNYSIYIIDDKGCISDTSTIIIGINQGANFNYNVTNMTVGFSMIDPANCTSGGFLWDYGNGMTSNIAQTPFVTYNNPGVYTACLQCNNAPSVCIVCANITVPGNYTGTTSTVGIEEQNNEKQNITIYPNPFTLTTTINFSEQQIYTTIKITDIIGNEIKTINFTGKQFVIDRAEMKSGIYFVQTTDEKKHISNKKIILQ